MASLLLAFSYFYEICLDVCPTAIAYFVQWLDKHMKSNREKSFMIIAMWELNKNTN